MRGARRPHPGAIDTPRRTVVARLCRQWRLVPVAVAAWVASGVGVTQPQAAPLVAAASWVAALATLAATWRQPGSRRVVPALAGIALAVVALTTSQVAVQQPAREQAAALAVGGRAVVVHATVLGKADRTATGDVMFDATAHDIAIGPVTHRVRVPIAVRGAARPDVGDTVTVHGTASRTLPGRRAVLVVRARDVAVTRRAGGVLAATAGMRHALAEASDGLSQPGAGLIAGLAVGDTGGVGTDLDTAMKASSLSHLTAVSGANCAVVVGLSFALAAACGAGRGVRVASGLAALAGFVVLVTPEPSVVRAAVMAAIAMVGLLLGRTGAGMTLLSAAVVVSLVADPWLATSIGFALSVAATGALLVLAGPLARAIARRLPYPVALAIAVPLAAQLACGPILIVLNPAVPLYAVVANLLAGPAAPVATVLGLLACVCAPVPVLVSGFVALTWLPAAWISSVALVSTRMVGSALPWPAGPLGVVALAGVGCAVVVVAIVPARTTRWGRVARAVSTGMLAVVAGVSVGATVMRTGVLTTATVPRAWAIAACDVGQGDALIVRSGAATALIDTGPDPAPLRTCLNAFGVHRVGLLVLTHYDHDHIGGLDAVVGRADLVLHGPPETARDRAVLTRLAATGADVRAASTGMTGSLGTARWTVLWPPADSRVFTGGNEASLVLDVRGGGVPTALFLGDMDAVSQRALLGSGALRPPYDVVKVAHHGSADQDPELYRAASAAVAVISVGAGNDYGHPRAPTLGFLRADGYVIVRTDRDGTVVLAAGSGAVRVWRGRAPPR